MHPGGGPRMLARACSRLQFVHYPPTSPQERVLQGMTAPSGGTANMDYSGGGAERPLISVDRLVRDITWPSDSISLSTPSAFHSRSAVHPSHRPEKPYVPPMCTRLLCWPKCLCVPLARGSSLQPVIRAIRGDSVVLFEVHRNLSALAPVSHAAAACAGVPPRYSRDTHPARPLRNKTRSERCQRRGV